MITIAVHGAGDRSGATLIAAHLCVKAFESRLRVAAICAGDLIYWLMPHLIHVHDGPCPDDYDVVVVDLPYERVRELGLSPDVWIMSISSPEALTRARELSDSLDAWIYWVGNRHPLGPEDVPPYLAPSVTAAPNVPFSQGIRFAAAKYGIVWRTPEVRGAAGAEALTRSVGFMLDGVVELLKSHRLVDALVESARAGSTAAGLPAPTHEDDLQPSDADKEAPELVADGASVEGDTSTDLDLKALKPRTLRTLRRRGLDPAQVATKPLPELLQTPGVGASTAADLLYCRRLRAGDQPAELKRTALIGRRDTMPLCRELRCELAEKLVDVARRAGCNPADVGAAVTEPLIRLEDIAGVTSVALPTLVKFIVEPGGCSMETVTAFAIAVGREDALRAHLTPSSSAAAPAP